MTKQKLIRDVLGSPIPQHYNEETGFFVANTNGTGDATNVDFTKKKLLRDALGGVIPQYYDVVDSKFKPVTSENSDNGEGVVGVSSVNGKSGAVILTAENIGAAKAEDLALANRQSQTLQHGLSVINGTVTSPVDVEIQGRTLVNLIYGTSPFSITLDNTKRYLLVTDNASAVTVDGVSQTTPYKFTGKSTTTLTWTTGNTALYEVEQADYNKILVDWNKDNVLNRYPYVKGLQHLNNPCILANIGNLLEPFLNLISSGVGSVDFKSTYSFDRTSTVNNQLLNTLVNVTPNTDYVFSCDIEGDGAIAAYNQGGSVPLAGYGNTPRIFNTGGNSQIRLFFRNNTIGKINFSNYSLTLGKDIKKFTSKNTSRLFANVKLGQIGTKEDILYKQEGHWLLRKVVNTEVEPPVLLSAPQIINVTDKVDGDILVNGLTQVEVTSGFSYTIDSNTGKRKYTLTPEKDRYKETVNATEVKLTYANNIRSALDDVVVKQASIATTVSVNVRTIAELYKRVRLLEGVQ